MPVQYFEDAGGECRYRIVAENGEPLVTSEGYRDVADAKRGFEALKRAIAATMFAPEWPGGVQLFTMPELIGAIRDGEEVPATAQPSRIESGPVRFGDDWTGLFLRGDGCFAYALALKAQLEDKGDAFSRAGLEGLITALESTNEKRTG